MRKIAFVAKDIWGREMGDRSLLVGSGTGNTFASATNNKIKIKNIKN